MTEESKVPSVAHKTISSEGTMSLIGEQLKKKADQMSKAVTLESNHGPATAGD